jgi:DNA-binding NtrC family response regulator
MVDAVADLEHAGRVLHNSSIDVVLAESEFPDGKNWRDFLEQMNRMPAPPPLIVFSPHADERLWAEVLNLGGYDLLLQPFDADETIRVLGLAARHAQAPRAAPAA